MKESFAETSKISFLGWLATVGTSLCFLPTTTNQSYVFTGAFVSGIVVLAGVGLRWARTPAVGVLAIQLVLLVEVLLLGFGEKLKFGIFPTTATFAGIRDIIDSGMDVASRYAAPAPESAGLTLLVVLTIGIVAVLVDFFAAGIRRVPLAGLPLLTMYTVPVTALPDGIPVYGFLPGAIAFVALLLADERERLAHWGRLVTRTANPSEQPTMDMSGLVSSGRRISFIAVSCAVVLPIFIPAFSASLIDTGRGTGSGDGDGPQLSFNDPMVSLASSLRQPEPVDLLKVSSPISPDYLRLVVLDQPGPNAWTAKTLDLDDTIDIDSVLPDPTGVSEGIATTQRQMSIEAQDAFPKNSTWLPVPYFSQFVDIDSPWGYVPRDQTVTATTETSAASLGGYDVTFSESLPTPDQLTSAASAPSDIQEEFGVVPDGIPSDIGTTARAVTLEARTSYEQAVLLQNFFRDSDQFDYDLDAGYGYGYQAMSQFLDKRRGFCQHFAATMAMMARTLGIPSRIVVGFLKPERTEDDGRYVLTSHNVHAWPELYFDGAGWMRFEPTPGVGATLPPWASSTLGPGGGTIDPTLTLPTDSQLTEDPRTERPSGAAADDAAGGGGGGGTAPSRVWPFAILILALVFVPAALRRGIRRSRLNRPVDESAAAEMAWLELRDHVRDLRLPWTGSMTPRARERSVAPLLMDDDAGLVALGRLALSVERSRYASTPLAGSSPGQDAATVMDAINRGAERGQRVRAFLWPSSLWPDLRAAWEAFTRRRQEPEPTAD